MPMLNYSLLIFVSNNEYKLQEYSIILNVPSLKRLDIPTIDPQDMNLETLVRNKIDIVQPILRDSPFFVEHTGLMIDAWNGFPGGLTKPLIDTVGCAEICRMLKDYDGRERNARVKTVLGYCYRKNIQIFEGTVLGTIAIEPRGKNGWDWDFIFIPEGYRQTYAEMGRNKHQMSMRRKAAQDFAQYLSHHFQHDDPDNDLLKTEKEDIKRLVKYHNRRLQKLKEQQALYGISADPRIVIEIEDIEEEISRLEIDMSYAVEPTT